MRTISRAGGGDPDNCRGAGPQRGSCLKIRCWPRPVQGCDQGTIRLQGDRRRPLQALWCGRFLGKLVDVGV